MVSSYYSKNVVQLLAPQRNIYWSSEKEGFKLQKQKNSNMLITNHGKLVGFESLILRFSNDLFPGKEDIGEIFFVLVGEYLYF